MTAQTTAQRQADLRARRAMLGLTEVRGIYLPPELHKTLREMARKLEQRASPAPGSEPFERWRKELRACLVQLLYVAHESKSPAECKAHPIYSSVMKLVDGGPPLGVTSGPRTLDQHKVQICRVAPIDYDNGQPCACPEGTCNLWKSGLKPARNES
jgi:hypothetical protein